MGRDGSPSRPFAERGVDVDWVNGGLGEPALPKAKYLKAKGDRDIS